MNQELLLGLSLKEVVTKLHSVDEVMTLKLAAADKVLQVVSSTNPNMDNPADAVRKFISSEL